MLTVLHRIDPEENMDRYYIITIQATLFDPIAVVCQYGSRHTAWQQTRVTPVADAAEAKELAVAIVKAKVGRGYEVVTLGQMIHVTKCAVNSRQIFAV